MKKLSGILIFTLALFACGGTTTSRVLKQTKIDAKIQGVGATDKDAQIAAEEIAKKIFGQFVIYKTDPCTTVKKDAKKIKVCIIYVNEK